MNKKDCKIIQDLLPNYIDNLTTKESNDFIENHIKECEDCKKVLENMKKDLKIDDNKNEKKIINFIKKYNKKMKILKLSLLAIIIFYVLVLGRKTIIMIDLANKASEYKDLTEYSLICCVNSDGQVWKNNFIAKEGKYVRDFEFASIYDGKKRVEEFNDGNSNSSNYYIEDNNGEKIAVLNHEKDGIIPLNIKDFCFEIPDNKLLFIRNIIKSKVNKEQGKYYITDIELEDFGTCNIYVSNGLIEKIIMRYPQYLGNKFSGDSIVTITYNTSSDILDSWLKKEDVNEYRIVKQ
jgi:hypothetical protein